MPDFYVGEIMLFAGDYCPDGWLPCDGSQLPIEQFNLLYSVIGTTFGYGSVNGVMQSFALPDLRGLAPVGMGQPPGRPPVQFGEQKRSGFPIHGTLNKGSLGLTYCICYNGYFPSTS